MNALTPLAHPIPDEALETDIATVSVKGAGKSTLNRGLVERLLDGGRRVIILDPLGHWYGLKAMADGSPGYPVAVIGGDHADVPLDPARGAELGAFLAQHPGAVVVDVSELPKSALIRFATDLLSALYLKNRDAVWLVLEEADIFAPQAPSTDGTRAMLDAVDMIARRGRARGFRLWSITQRPARIAKDVLTQAATICALRIGSPQDRAAVEDWLLGHVETKEARRIVGTLASLSVGEGWILNPSLDLLERAQFPMPKTLDTSATPKAGQSRPRDVRLAQADLEGLRALLIGDPTPEPPARAAKAPPAPSKTYEQGVQAGVRLGLSRALAALMRAVNDVREQMGEKPAAITLGPLSEADLERVRADARQPGGGLRPVSEHLRGLVQVDPPQVPDPPLPQITVTGDARTPLNSASRKLLAALARYHGRGLSWAEACIVAGLMAGNGHMNSGRKALRDHGLVEEDSGRVRLTATGRREAGEPGRELTRRDFKELWGGKRQPAPRMFNVLVDACGCWVALDELAEAVSLKRNNGFWNSGLSQLREAGLIEQEAGRVRVIDFIGRAAT